MPNIGAPELIVILVIALLVLGPKKLPEVGRSVGKGMREFKESLAGHDDDDEVEPRPVIAAAPEPPPAVPATPAAVPATPAAEQEQHPPAVKAE